jgi:hypothetical protein
MTMTRKKPLAGMIALGAALALTIASPGTARADYYGYAEQTITSLAFTGATVGTVGMGSQSSASQIGVPGGSESHTASLDALQSFVGPSGRPAENTYTPLGQVHPDYIRGDSQIVAPATLNSVAEGFKTFPGNSAGAGSVSLSAPITVTAAGTVTLSFNFANMVSVFQNSPGGSVAANVTFEFDIQNSSGTNVFRSTPDAVNVSFSLTTIGNAGATGSGSVTITSGVLAAGTYQGTITEGSNVFISAVPEPSSVVLMGIGGLSAFFLVRRTRRLHQQASL